MQYSRFATDTTPWCVWDWDLGDQTETFLKTFDPTYFEYIVKTHEDRLDGDDARHAATAIRTVYCHAVETLFALLGAIAQAPDCPAGWIQKYRPEHLDNFVENVSRGRGVLSKLPEKPLTWKHLAEGTLRCLSLQDKEKEARVKSEFAKLWSRLAHEFLSSEIRAEYNSIKHGFRIGSGGSWISVGKEDTPGVACAPEKMQVMGGSEFGSTFYEPIELAKHNIRLRRRSVNWDPIVLAGRVRLISMSLHNLVSFLSIGHGKKAEEMKFRWPAELQDFTQVWPVQSLTSSAFSTIIELHDIDPQTKDEILAVYVKDDES